MKRLFPSLAGGLFFFLFPGAAGASNPSAWLRDINGENSGHTVAYFLTLPVEAGELSIGGASSCGAMDATDACFFTANTALFNRQKLAATHLEWLMGLRKEILSACFPIEDVGTIGFFSQVFTPGAFDNAYTIDETPSHPSLLDYSAGLSFARSFFHSSLSAGAAISYVESRLDGAAGRTVCVNADCAVSPSPFFSMHVRAGNIGPGLSYTDNVPEPLPLLAACALAIKPLAMQEELLAVIDPQIGLGAKKIADEPLVVGVNAQATMFHAIIARAGYEYPMGSDRPAVPGLSAGIGLQQKNFGADFGWKDQSKEFGSVWSITLKAQLKEMIVKTAEDYYFLAQRYYGQGRLKQSLSNAKKAVDLDPNMWKAHVLISTINALKRRESGTEMAFIYTGNTGGRFLPAPAGEGARMGGYARQASVIKQLRAQFPLTMLIDAGNFLTSATLPVKARLADWYYRQCAYDAVAMGAGEFDFGLDRLFTKTAPPQSEYCCTNIAGPLRPGVVRSKIVTIKGYTLYVMSVVGPALPKRPQDRALLAAPIAEITEFLSKNAAKNATVRILVINDSWERACALARSLPEVDIVVCGGMRQKFETPMKIGTTLLLSPGENGAYVGKLIMRFNEQKKLISFDNHLIALTEDIAPDSAVNDKLRLAIESGGAQEQNVVEPDMKKTAPDGVFVFLSNRDGVAGIFLKVPNNQAEFRLTRDKNECAKPSVSFAGGKCAYLEKTTDTSCPVLQVMNLSGAEKRTIPFNGCINEAVFSPNGKWLYFSGHTDSSTDGIFRIRPEGSGLQPIVDWKQSSQRYFDVSPDNAAVVFGSNGNGKWQLFITDSLGRRPICFTEAGSDNKLPRFSPSGEYCAFLSNKTSFGGSYDLWEYAMAGGKADQITVNAKVNDFCWLSDGQTIVCSSGEPRATLKTINPATNACARLIGGDSIMAYAECAPRLIAYKNAWKIVYTRVYSNGDKKIFWVNLDGSGDQRIVNSKGQDWLE